MKNILVSYNINNSYLNIINNILISAKNKKNLIITQWQMIEYWYRLLEKYNIASIRLDKNQNTKDIIYNMFSKINQGTLIISHNMFTFLCNNNYLEKIKDIQNVIIDYKQMQNSEQHIINNYKYLADMSENYISIMPFYDIKIDGLIKQLQVITGKEEYDNKQDILLNEKFYKVINLDKNTGKITLDNLDFDIYTPRYLMKFLFQDCYLKHLFLKNNNILLRFVLHSPSKQYIASINDNNIDYMLDYATLINKTTLDDIYSFIEKYNNIIKIIPYDTAKKILENKQEFIEVPLMNKTIKALQNMINKSKSMKEIFTKMRDIIAIYSEEDMVYRIHTALSIIEQNPDKKFLILSQHENTVNAMHHLLKQSNIDSLYISHNNITSESFYYLCLRAEKHKTVTTQLKYIPLHIYGKDRDIIVLDQPLFRKKEFFNAYGNTTILQNKIENITYNNLTYKSISDITYLPFSVNLQASNHVLSQDTKNTEIVIN